MHSTDVSPLEMCMHCARLAGRKAARKKIPPVLKVHASPTGDRHLRTSLLPTAVMANPRRWLEMPGGSFLIIF